MSKKSANRKTAEDAIRFLDSHMLDPTPSNYAFAYLYMTGVSGSMRKAVDNITYGGTRLNQAEVDELMGSVSETPGAAPDGKADEIHALLRHQILSIADLTATTRSDTGSFGRDLVQGAESIDSGADLIGVIRAMIDRTAEVERKLAKTCEETEKLRQDLDTARDDATRDALTNLPNRRAFDRTLSNALADGSDLAVAFCDIDHFKSINDRFGHAVGDRVLKAVAETLAETLDPHVVARFGGEEFVVLLPNTGSEVAFELIERARKAVGERNFRTRDTDERIGQVTFSAGIATTSNDAEQALHDADVSLYEAKNSGRNRTICKKAA